MKIKKILRKSLIFSLFISNIVNISLATSVQDERYEFLNGNKIAVENIIDGSQAKLDVSGNTLNNLLDKSSFSDNLTIVGNIGENIELYNNGFKITTIEQPDGYYRMKFKFRLSPKLNGKIATLSFKSSGDNLITCLYNQTLQKTEYIYEHGNSREFVFPDDNDERYLYFAVGNDPIDGDTYKQTYIIDDIMLIEGSHVGKEYGYFEGLKSTGEDKSNVELEIQNGIPITDYFYGTQSNNTNVGGDWTSVLFRCKPNTTYTIEKIDNSNRFGIEQCFYNGPRKSTTGNTELSPYLQNGVMKKTITTKDSSYGNYIKIYLSNEEHREFRINIFEGNDITSSNYMRKTITIPIIEPLRSLPDGTSDRIIYKNGKWMIERNTNEVILNGSENWQNYRNTITGVEGEYGTVSYAPLQFDDLYADRNTNNIISDKITSIKGVDYDYNKEMIYTWKRSAIDNCIYIHIQNDKLATKDLDGYKNYFKDNPLKVIYKTITPRYEEIKSDLDFSLFNGDNYISTNYPVPFNVSVEIDRALNKAADAIQEAKQSPTSQNISNARFWVNILDESILKDNMQNELNDVKQIDGLGFQKLTSSANLDIYIKSDNMLSLSVSTSSVNFNDYSGTEDIELKDAITLSINSSLPYNINATMPTKILNSNGSKEIDMSLFNIKESGEVNYQQFENTTNEIVLKSGCQKGNNKSHKIDLKLSSNQAHRADIYKTTIKFEVEQN